jgi:hypothetical protein
MESANLISRMTKTLGGRPRIMEVERIENATGLSTRYSTLQAAQDPIVAELVRVVSQEPNRFSPRPTDNGLRFTCEWRHCTWYVYSY